MKNILLVLIVVLAGIKSFAQSNELIGYKEVSWTSGYVCNRTVENCSGGYAAPKNEGEAALLIDILINDIDSRNKKMIFENECSEKLSVVVGDMCRETVFLKLYCKPRPYSEIALMSLFDSCKINPQASCFDPKLLASFDKIKPMKSKIIDKTTKCFEIAGAKR